MQQKNSTGFLRLFLISAGAKGTWDRNALTIVSSKTTLERHLKFSIRISEPC